MEHKIRKEPLKLDDDELQSQQPQDDDEDEHDEVDSFQATQQLIDENDENDVDTPNSESVNQTIKEALSIHEIDSGRLIDYLAWANRKWDDVNVATVRRCLNKHGISEIELKRYIRQHETSINL